MADTPHRSEERNVFQATAGTFDRRADSSVRESIWLLTRRSGVQIPLGPFLRRTDVRSRAVRDMNPGRRSANGVSDRFRPVQIPLGPFLRRTDVRSRAARVLNATKQCRAKRCLLATTRNPIQSGSRSSPDHAGYVPSSRVRSITASSIAERRASASVPGGSSSCASNAKSSNRYRCSLSGGFGPP